MLSQNEIEIIVNNQTLKYYRSKGYYVPTTEVQLWAHKKDKRVKNGKDYRVVRGTKINIKIEDLPPSSNEIIDVFCEKCKVPFKIKYQSYISKRTKNCKKCVCSTVKGDGSRDYWVNKLIRSSTNATCDISGETDKRFLILHHLQSVKSGGRNIVENYVILSANYHMAFHNSLGGMNVPCTKEDYVKFKDKELLRLKEMR